VDLRGAHRGAGDDVYRDVISWSPFLNLEHARSAGRILAKLPEAAGGYDAPNRSVEPLTGGFTIFGDQTDPLAAAEKYVAARPALAADLAHYLALAIERNTVEWVSRARPERRFCGRPSVLMPDRPERGLRPVRDS
jgi:S-formylglutathione hydrolase FrmB